MLYCLHSNTFVRTRFHSETNGLRFKFARANDTIFRDDERIPFARSADLSASPSKQHTAGLVTDHSRRSSNLGLWGSNSSSAVASIVQGIPRQSACRVVRLRRGYRCDHLVRSGGRNGSCGGHRDSWPRFWRGRRRTTRRTRRPVTTQLCRRTTSPRLDYASRYVNTPFDSKFLCTVGPAR